MNQPRVEVRRNDDGSIDEVVARGVDVHIEQMNDAVYFVSITRRGEDIFRGSVGIPMAAPGFVELWDEETGPVRGKRKARMR